NGKPVFDVEYTDSGAGGCDSILASDVAAMCSYMTKTFNFESFVKGCNLGNEYTSCWSTYDKGYRIPKLA
ncbi:hypothetical protein HDU76_006696, partial [Blyttiomyces sp. JEL0837]